MEESKVTSFILALKRCLYEKRGGKLVVTTKKVSKSRSMMSLSNMDVGEDPFRYCLAHEEFVESFKVFLKKIFCVENLLFYLESTHFRKFYDEIPEDLRPLTALRIFRTYVEVGSHLEVNIDEETREGITAAVRHSQFDGDLFLEATRAIFRLMEDDSFPKWQRTKDFRRVWKKNGSLPSLSPTPHFL